MFDGCIPPLWCNARGPVRELVREDWLLGLGKLSVKLSLGHKAKARI